MAQKPRRQNPIVTLYYVSLDWDDDPRKDQILSCRARVCPRVFHVLPEPHGQGAYLYKDETVAATNPDTAVDKYLTAKRKQITKMEQELARAWDRYHRADALRTTHVRGSLKDMQEVGAAMADNFLEQRRTKENNDGNEKEDHK